MDDEHHRQGGFQPLLVGLLGIIGGAIMVATYHCVATVCCTHRHSEGFTNNDQNDTPERPAARLRVISHGSSTTMKLRASSSVIRYGKEIDAGTCAICLTDFKEEEDVRVLPECLHVFHVPCIDMWLVSHPNCPLCRANAVHTAALLPDSGGGRSQELHRLQNIRG